MRAFGAIAYAAVIAGAMAVASCGQTGYGDAARGIIRDKGAEVADEGLVNLEWALCNAQTIGAIRRRYVGTRKWAAYVIICEWPAEYLVEPPRRLIP